MIEVVHLPSKLSLISEYWSPRIVGELNGQHIKIAKLKGAFVWHAHDLEDEMFLVLQGRFTMEFRDHRVDVHEREFLIVPRGIEHRPVAEEDVSVLLFEPAGTRNTGNAINERTIDHPEWI
jgi:mannose-6-phosphate isomerase-like protein (cupin superfamily)